MKYWEFLIQQEGDLAWLPLKSPATEVLEGRYRVVARCDGANATADILISYESPDRTVPTQRVHKRRKQMDAQGVAIVLPYTDFKPGIWNFGSSGRGDGESSESDWQYAVKLRVRPKVVKDPEDPQAGDRASQAEGEPSQSPNPAYQLRLDREALTLHSQETVLTLSGQINATDSKLLEALHLRIRLRDPETARSVVTTQRLIRSQQPPLSFSYPINLPAHCKTRLMLGEILLCDATPNVLASQSFTVTVNLEGLLDQMEALQERRDGEKGSPGQPSKPMVQKPDGAVNPSIPSWPTVPIKPGTRPLREQQALPPLLHPSESRPMKSVKSLELPFSGDRQEVDDQPTEKPTAQTPLPKVSATSDSPAPPKASETPPVEPSAHPLDPFTARLSQIAKDEELSEWLAADLSRSADNPFQLQAETEPQGDLGDWETAEIVVEDDPSDEVATVPKRLAEPEVPASYQLPPDEPVPRPELILPKGKLTAGRMVTLRVKLPQLEPRIFVKLWIHDRQNHALLDGPRWLTDFIPTGTNEVETITQLMMPYGGLEVQFEAIAVEMQTQRESHKITVEREVVPPGPPVLPLEKGR